MPTLATCPSCSTHIRVDEITCPFCGEPLATSSGAKRVIAAVRLVSILAIAGCAYGLPPHLDAGHPVDSHPVDSHPADARVVDAP